MERFVGGVSGRLNASSIHLMTSAGGLENAWHFRPKDSLLSGPAGGIVGASSAAAAHGIGNILTFDMGGTSTDVARVDDGFSYRFEHRVGPVHLLAPALRIETVAAGGGSICGWKPTGLSVGPESAGADPGPACYGKGGPLTLTDVNFLLGRLDPNTVQIPLSRQASRLRLAELAATVESETGEKVDPASLLTGLVDIANTTMADAIRSVSIREGYDPSHYTLLAFGGAGPMHACGIADLLGIERILVPGDPGLLSAAGLRDARMERFAERQILRPLPELKSELDGLIADLEREAKAQLVANGLSEMAATSVRRIAEIRIAGQDHSLSIDFASYPDLETRFSTRFRDLFGYEIPADREIEIVSVRVIISESVSLVSPRVENSHATLLSGPKVVGGPFSTLYVAENWFAEPTADGGHLLTLANPSSSDSPRIRSASKAVTAELFRHRFASIADEMGELLRLTAISTNIKERLDFSCALLSAKGELVVNAPHIPVHLGALGECVRRVATELPLSSGDTVITNHPAYGGSHLPDVTLITPVFDSGGNTLLGYVANRAHHAEIGGITPGSMPPDARNLSEEGAVIPPTFLVRKGRTDFETVFEILNAGPYASRRTSDNAADLRAQLAANRRGGKLLKTLADTHGEKTVRDQMEQILGHSHRTLTSTLAGGALHPSSAEEHLDDGSLIKVNILPEADSITFDFEGHLPRPSEEPECHARHRPQRDPLRPAPRLKPGSSPQRRSSPWRFDPPSPLLSQPAVFP